MENNEHFTKICFIGVGSIAMRHIKNIYKLFGQMGEKVVIDAYRSGNGMKLDGTWVSLIRKCYTKYEDINEIYDVIFITNPTQFHFETLKKFQKKGRSFFIEKPVFSKGNVDLSALQLDENKMYYVACPLRYTCVIQYLKNNIDFTKIFSIRAISSSYLPEWRPGADYRNTYSAHKDLGGGVAIDLIHEWDYLTYLLGMPEKVVLFKEKLSNLEIDSEDIAIYIAKYKDKLVELHLDYFGRKAIREILLFMEDETISCDLINSRITFLKENKVISFKEDRDTYQIKELKHFFDLLRRGDRNDNDISKACKLISLTEGYIK